MAICKGCSAELAENANFCSRCGMPCNAPEETVEITQETPTQEVSETEATVEATPVAEPSAEESPASETVAEETAEESAVPQSEPSSAPVVAMTAAETSNDEHTCQQECLNSVYIRLKHERLCWKICGIFYLVFCAVFFVIGIATCWFGVGFVFLLYSILFLPIAIINMVMIGKVDYYRNSLYNDCGPTVTRSTSVGNIVFAAFFNEIALIFIIINFVFVKRNKAVFDKIKHNQDVFNHRV